MRRISKQFKILNISGNTRILICLDFQDVKEIVMEATKGHLVFSGKIGKYFLEKWNNNLQLNANSSKMPSR